MGRRASVRRRRPDWALLFLGAFLVWVLVCARLACAATYVAAPISEISVTGSWGSGSTGCVTAGGRPGCLDDYPDTNTSPGSGVGYIACGSGAPCTARYNITLPTLAAGSSISQVSVEFTVWEASSGGNDAQAC